ncbi:glycosyltransferase involved in cell wall biosynthesis [Tepidamorphus gemmatus]|uniref:Glycosyltransferase involved in cell wall biosynthesis n=1 Tax=Tepidamorphus gemmatus TaxID=747076 RepID=A0A4R3M8C9_9HYPH|nr:glycosyltransferase family 4 protein [Tepidamorphus gemmatus]TCT09356.1 glycosyltransferase involved in cell wall biosynthesis [Tepidamorphus gemmatus]
MARVAILVKGYPRLSETFIAQEILGLEARGLDILIVSLRRPTDPAVHDLHRAIRAEVLYLPEYLKDEPARVRAGRRHSESLPGHAAAAAAFRADLELDRTVNRWRRWGQAQVLARELPADVGWLHVHYLHTPASVARYAAALTGLGWSFSAHAKDIWTTPVWELERKLADARWGVTCTAANRAYLAGLAARPDSIGLVYHGLDFTRFPAPAIPGDNDGSPGRPVRLLAVGRAVEKKGFDDLLRALARVGDAVDWRLTHIGGGALIGRLRDQAERLGIADRVCFRGALAHDAVIEAFRAADLFVLPSRIAKSGDRDGLPNVLMEAQILGVAAIATPVSAIPELIEDGRTGLLVPPRDPTALASAIIALARNPAARQRLAAAGRARTLEHFAAAPGLDRIAQMLRESLRRKAA